LQSSAVRTPSDVFGLYDIVNECIEEADDPTLHPDVLRREQEREGSEDEEWFKDVANIVLGESSTVPMELVDVLFKPHRVLYDADLRLLTSGLDHYAVAVIGTPLWIAKSWTEDDVVLPSRLRRYQADTVPSIPGWQPPAITQRPQPATAEGPSEIEGRALAEPPGQLPVRIPLAAPPIDANRTWESFDAQLEDMLRTDPQDEEISIGSPAVADQEWVEAHTELQDEEISIASPAVADQEWDEFCQWFVDQASRFGGPPAALPTGGPWASHNRKGPMYPRYYGWVVPFNDDEVLIMFTDGDCRLATHWRKTTYRVTELKSRLREVAFRTLFLQVRYWWLVPGGSIRPLPPSTLPVYPRRRRPRRRWPIWKWLEQQKHQDPFTTKLDLEPFRPFAYSHDEAVHFRNRYDTHWLVLDSIYTSQQGVTVHVVRPADLDILGGLGSGMDNFAGDLVKAIRERDTKAIALFSYWPDVPPDINVIRRLIFTRAEEKLSIFEEVRHLLSHTGEAPRYRDTAFYHYGFDVVSNMLGTPVPREFPAEVAARANRLPDWATLESQARKANDERP
jgi:hypothetical protein